MRMYVGGMLSVYMSKVNPYKYSWNFLTTAHLRVRNSQLVYWVMGFSLAQASTGVGYYCFGAILSGLIEDSSKPVPQASV